MTRTGRPEGCITLKRPAMDGRPAVYEVRVTLRPAVIVDPVTGHKKRNTQSVTVHGTERDAEKKRRELLGHVDHDTHVKPSKLSLTEHLGTWLTRAIEPAKRPNTVRCYKVIVGHISESWLGRTPLQAIRASHLEAYLATVSIGSLGLYRGVLSSALALAVRDRLILTSPAALKLTVPKPPAGDDIRIQCWSEQEAATVIAAAKQQDEQQSAFYQLALDGGMRRNELLGLGRDDVDVEGRSVFVRRQLASVSPVTFAVTKTGKVRRVAISEETAEALLLHRRTQAELKLRSGDAYHDHGLCFARTEVDPRTGAHLHLGEPLEGLATWMFHRLVASTGVKRIRFHDLRHTSASLSLAAGVRAEVVAARIGDTLATLMRVYAHVLEHHQADAAERLARVLHRR